MLRDEIIHEDRPSDYSNTPQKSQITKIMNSEENSTRKVHNQMGKSKAQTHQTNE